MGLSVSLKGRITGLGSEGEVYREEALSERSKRGRASRLIREREARARILYRLLT